MLAAFLPLMAAAQAPFPAPPPMRVRRVVSGTIAETDYPAAAMQAWAQGTTTAEVDLGDDGRATACRIARSSGNAELDQRSCVLIRLRFRFEPAAPDLASRRTVDIAWRLPADVPPPVPFASSSVYVLISLAAAGTPYCQRRVVGLPPVSIVGIECPPEMNAAAPPRTTFVGAVFLEMVVADGRMLPWPRGGNDPAEDYRLRFEVNGEGRVAACRVVPRWDMSRETQGLAQRRCDQVRSREQPLFTPDPSRPLRRAEFIVASVVNGRS